MNGEDEDDAAANIEIAADALKAASDAIRDETGEETPVVSVPDVIVPDVTINVDQKEDAGWTLILTELRAIRETLDTMGSLYSEARLHLSEALADWRKSILPPSAETETETVTAETIVPAELPDESPAESPAPKPARMKRL